MIRLTDFFQDRIVFEAFGVAEIYCLELAFAGPVVAFAGHLTADGYGCIAQVLKIEIGPGLYRQGVTRSF